MIFDDKLICQKSGLCFRRIFNDDTIYISKKYVRLVYQIESTDSDSMIRYHRYMAGVSCLDDDVLLKIKNPHTPNLSYANIDVNFERKLLLRRLSGKKEKSNKMINAMELYYYSDNGWAKVHTECPGGHECVGISVLIDIGFNDGFLLE